MPDFSPIAGELLKSRYYQNGEDWEELCRRVAKTIAGVEKTKELRKKWEQTFFDMLYNLEFLPNSPVLWGAGFQKKTLSACFVIPVEDNLESIFDAVKRAGMIFKAGGGVGINFSKLRPKGESVSAGGTASGAIIFLELFDTTGDVIKQGGQRRSAQMSILHCGHPEIRDFILAKSEPGTLINMNLSVAITNDFMKKATSDKSEWDLVFHNQTIKDDAKELLYLISQKAWESGEPGVIFLDRMNEDNSCPKVAKIKGTNPCITGDTWINTIEGRKQVFEALGKQTTLLINGKQTPTTEEGFFFTGVKPIFEIETKHGYKLKATADHKIMTDLGWTEVQNLTPKDKIRLNCAPTVIPDINDDGFKLGYLLGQIYGNGYFNKSEERAYLQVWIKNDEKPEDNAMMNYILECVKSVKTKGEPSWGLPVVRGEYSKYTISNRYLYNLGISLGFYNPETRIKSMDNVYLKDYGISYGFTVGMFDADGTVAYAKNKNLSVRLGQSDIIALEHIQRMLLDFGVVSTLYKNRVKEMDKLMPNGKGGQKLYHCKATHELCISKDNLQRFHGFIHPQKKAKYELHAADYKEGMYAESFFSKVKSIIPMGEAEVFDCTVPDGHKFAANGMIISNCSEQPLRPNESCTLGSINLDKFIDENGIFDIGGFEECIYNATRFLDNTIEANYFPDDLIDNATKKTRPIGLGLMGLADYLIKRRVVYGSDESLGEIEFLCKVLHRETVKASALLGAEKGSFPAFRKSKFFKKHKAMRNSQHNTIAPTGTISIIAGCSSGIEPYYSFASIQRSVAGFDHDVIIDSKYKYILQSGIEEWKNVLISGQEITADKHIKVLATAQKYIDTGISKTISLPEEATVEDVRDTFILAWQLGCKGVTVFRERNKNRQALLKEVCPDHKVPLVPSGRCMVCPVCGFSNRCSIG